MTIAINLENVNYRYPKNQEPSLKKINLTIKEGKFIAIMGPTGAGKTTLTLCLNGLIPQLLEGELTGRITVAGKDLSKKRVQEMSKYIGLVFEDAEAQIFGRTVEEDIAFGPKNFSLPSSEIHKRVQQVLEKVGLCGFEKRNTSELSGGEKQRLAIAGVLAMQPEILVLDEATSELDPQGRAEIYQMIDDLRRERGMTILAVEHSSEEIVKRADEIIVINGGRIAWKGEPQILFRNIPLLNQLGIKPLPVSLLGWELHQKGLITFDEIPLDVSEGEAVIKDLMKKQGKGFLKDILLYSTTNRKSKESEALVEVTNLSYKYASGQLALENINLKVQRGEFIALIGQNGAGKTTLAKHLNGLLKPSEGEVVVQGKNTREFHTSQLSQLVGYVFQNPDHQIFSETVEKELQYGLKNAGIKGFDMEERVNEALKITGLEEKRHVHPFSLGKGERQLLAVASILALKPKILVVDEPTTGLDTIGVNNIMHLFKKLHKSGTTIIMISHDMDLVERYAERIIVMKKGRILMDDSTEKVFANFKLLKEAAILPPQFVRLSKRIECLVLEGEEQCS